MARILGRSRSLRMLKGGHKETHQRDTDIATPQPTLSQVEFDRLKATTPVSREDRKVETPEMLQPPKTSGGPGDRSMLFHKKVTPIPHCENEGFEFASPTKSTTVLYAAKFDEEREGIIGIALGSPTMASHWTTTPQATDFVTNRQGPVTHISSSNHSPSGFAQAIEGQRETPKPKLSRWKSLFKKTVPPPPPPQEKDSFYQLAKSITPARADSHHDDESLDSYSLAQQENESCAVSPPTIYNPQIRESRKLPKGQPQTLVDTRPRALTAGVNPIGRKSTLIRSASSPKPNYKSGFSNSPTVPQVVVSSGSENLSPRANGEKPLLDVDIPTVHMERYSVMFSSLLQHSSNNSSSLLQRRQGNPEKLKPLNELSMKKEEDRSQNGSLKPQRRATSPSFPPKSPSGHLSLFPSTNTSRAPSPRSVSVHRPRLLLRSKTAPSRSPHQQSFPKEVSEDGANASSQESKKPAVETLNPATPSLSRSSSPSSERSFDSDSEEITIVVACNAPGQSWKPRVEENEPEWEIVSKPAANTHAITKASVLSSHPASAQPSSAPLELPPNSRSPGLYRSKSQMLSPGPRSADRLASENPGNGALATVGVARSLSVTRANRPELLIPGLLKPVTMDGAGRYVDSKPLTPTLVELKNRKSQRVQLVDA